MEKWSLDGVDGFDQQTIRILELFIYIEGYEEAYLGQD